ncbi:MAG: type II toxin-antitoxin system VapC family toxin [Geminicoccaceae bacterium]|nr:type II toxin-antitoxin system VapC family toxin [Geminicoccaceae bacterium]
MTCLFDTHLLLWAGFEPERLPKQAAKLLEQSLRAPLFSAASIWEIAIKALLGRADFTVDPAVFRKALLENGYEELAITGAHAAMTRNLPEHHKDPFDRLLLAQAMVEGLTLVTADRKLAAYEGPIRHCG